MFVSLIFSVTELKVKNSSFIYNSKDVLSYTLEGSAVNEGINVLLPEDINNIGEDRWQQLVDEIEAALQQQAVREISSEDIGEHVLSHLQKINEVAYVRFASVYRQFQGIRDFTEALSQLKDNGHDTADSSMGSEHSQSSTVHPAVESLPRGQLASAK